MGTCSVSYLMQEPHLPILPIGSVASVFRSKLDLTRFTWCPFYTGPWFTLQVQLTYVAVTLSSVTFSRRGKTEHHNRFLKIMPYTHHHMQLETKRALIFKCVVYGRTQLLRLCNVRNND
jgi:hypothetical protein